MNPLALEVAGVTKRYGERDIVRDVSLTVQPGVLHGLLGPNGAGKTTLMRVLLGLVRRSAGAVRLLGHAQDSLTSCVPPGVAGLVDTPAFYPYLSGRQNLSLLARLDDGRTSASSRARAVAQALDNVGLVHHAEAAVRGYSAGMRQRLGLAAACLRAPKLLFLDEPTSSLDPASARQVRTLVRRMAAEGTAIVFSSHDIDEVEELCTALTVLNGGRVVFSGPVEELRGRTTGPIHLLHTSDDDAAGIVALQSPGVTVLRSGDGLELAASLEALDACVISLARVGVAVRRLEQRTRSLESLFLELTEAVPPLGQCARAAVQVHQPQAAELSS